MQSEGTPELLLGLEGNRLTDPSSQAIVQLQKEAISRLVRVSWLDLLTPAAPGVRAASGRCFATFPVVGRAITA